VRKDIALRLLESVEVVDDDAIEEAWTNELSSRVDDIVSGKVTAVPGEQVCRHRRPTSRPQRMTLAFDFHPEAQAEFAADVDWYDPASLAWAAASRRRSVQPSMLPLLTPRPGRRNLVGIVSRSCVRRA
jgi:putative addiction module component (TIGR02574 family)